MNISLDIPVGKYRAFKPSELRELNNLLADSSKVFEPEQETGKKPAIKPSGPRRRRRN